jgi:phage shock protein E
MKIDLDVRTTQEWNEGHKENAMHFDLARLMAGEILDVPKDAHIQVYCRSGGRAGMACDILVKQGFTDVHNAGGFTR